MNVFVTITVTELEKSEKAGVCIVIWMSDVTYKAPTSRIHNFIVQDYKSAIGKFTSKICHNSCAIILLNIMSLDIDIIYTNDIFRLQSSDTTFGVLLYLA